MVAVTIFCYFNKNKKATSFTYLQLNSRGSTHNLGHDILELYNVLVQIRLTTSKTKRDI